MFFASTTYLVTCLLKFSAGTFATTLYGTNEYTTDSVVAENALAGPIPTQIGHVVPLTHLDLDNNQLTGSWLKPGLIATKANESHVFSCAGRMPTELGLLHLNFNQLTGKARFWPCKQCAIGKRV